MEIRIPTDAWDDDAPAVLDVCLCANGERVSEGSVIAQLMVEKVQFDLVAPASGTVEWREAEGATVSKGQVVGHVHQ